MKYLFIAISSLRGFNLCTCKKIGQAVFYHCARHVAIYMIKDEYEYNSGKCYIKIIAVGFVKGKIS